MSLAEVPNFDERRSSAPEFDRTPPQDLVAEQSVFFVVLRFQRLSLPDPVNLHQREVRGPWLVE